MTTGPARRLAPLRQAILATQFLTRIPTPQVTDFEQEDLSRSAAWFPAVGLMVGLFVALATGLGAARDPWLGAFLGLATWAWITGALHLDGLGDLVDALGASHSKPERLHEVLHDPHTGTFAVVAIVLQLMAKLVGLHALVIADVLWVLLPLAALARLGPLYWTRSLPTIAPGSGERFAWSVPSGALVGWALALAPAMIYAPHLLLAALAIPFWRMFLQRKLGGQTGDALGAGIEIVESFGLLALAAW